MFYHKLEIRNRAQNFIFKEIRNILRRTFSYFLLKLLDIFPRKKTMNRKNQTSQILEFLIFIFKSFFFHLVPEAGLT